MEYVVPDSVEDVTWMPRRNSFAAVVTVTIVLARFVLKGTAQNLLGIPTGILYVIVPEPRVLPNPYKTNEFSLK